MNPPLLSFCGLPVTRSTAMGLAAANWSHCYETFLFAREANRMAGSGAGAEYVAMMEAGAREALALVWLAAMTGLEGGPGTVALGRSYAVRNALGRARSARKAAFLRREGELVRVTVNGQQISRVVKLGGAK